MQYQSVPQLSREEYARMIASHEASEVSTALLGIAYWERDWQWAQSQLLTFVDSHDSQVRYTAVLGFGHIARFNGKLDTDSIEPVLRRIAESDHDSKIRKVAEDTLEDINIYIHRPKQQHRAFVPARRLN
jgi:hypothetical protein